MKMRGNRRRSSPSDEKVEAEEFHPLDAELSRSEVLSPKNEYPHGKPLKFDPQFRGPVSKDHVQT